jgi:RND family efflux transporter MFP subunit
MEYIACNRILSMNRSFFAALIYFVGGLLSAGIAGEAIVALQEKTELKAVFGQVQSRTVSVARVRIGGTVTGLKVTEGTSVRAGDELAVVIDDKLALQLEAIDSRIKGLESEMNNAAIELARAKKLLATGVIAKTRVDSAQTQFDVMSNQFSAAQSDRSVIAQQTAEGRVLAPASGRVLAVPVTEGTVVLPGEPVARIASNGYFIRLSLPERHAAHLNEGDDVQVGERGLDPASSNKATASGKLVKVYPEIDNGRVLADVEVKGLGDFFVGERTLVWVPVAKRSVLSVPASAISTRSGIDYVTLKGGASVAVIIGEVFEAEEITQVEIMSGLEAGDMVIVP